MAREARTRASDADRDQTAAALREHLAAGRLTTEEFDERLDKTYAAKTLGELDDLMADLPVTDLDQLPDASLQRSAGDAPAGWRRPSPPAGAGQGRLSPAWRAAWGSWLAISLVFVVIWLVSGASGGLWFLWVPAILAALLAGRWITGAPPRSERRSARPGRSRRHHDSDQARQ